MIDDLEQAANEEARHAHREALEAAQARIAELEAERDAAWNAALEAAAECCTAELRNTNTLLSNPPQSAAALDARDAIRALMKKEGE